MSEKTARLVVMGPIKSEQTVLVLDALNIESDSTQLWDLSDALVTTHDAPPPCWIRHADFGKFKLVGPPDLDITPFLEVLQAWLQAQRIAATIVVEYRALALIEQIQTVFPDAVYEE